VFSGAGATTSPPHAGQTAIQFPSMRGARGVFIQYNINITFSTFPSRSPSTLKVFLSSIPIIQIQYFKKILYSCLFSYLEGLQNLQGKLLLPSSVIRHPSSNTIKHSQERFLPEISGQAVAPIVALSE